jgi:hypothetical protein
LVICSAFLNYCFNFSPSTSTTGACTTSTTLFYFIFVVNFFFLFVLATFFLVFFSLGFGVTHPI